jgi:hypothetical protein
MDSRRSKDAQMEMAYQAFVSQRCLLSKWPGAGRESSALRYWSPILVLLHEQQYGFMLHMQHKNKNMLLG